MSIKEMHELFRVLGQQMGMQRVRGILPESIDALLYTSAVHCVRQIITSNVTTNFGNIVATQKNKISVINALRTLYREEDRTIIYDIETIPDPVYLDSFYKDFNVFSIIDCVVSYDEDFPSKYISSRLIEPNLVADAERDYLLRPSLKYPIVTIIGVDDNYANELPGERFEYGTRIQYNIYTGGNKPTRLKTSFIKYPAKVHLDEEVESNNVDCDLPIHFHHMVVEEAVNLYLQSVHFTSGSNNNSQEHNKNNIQ